MNPILLSAGGILPVDKFCENPFKSYEFFKLNHNVVADSAGWRWLQKNEAFLSYSVETCRGFGVFGTPQF